MNLVEKLESWRWIRPIPSKPPKREDHKTFDSRTNSGSEKKKSKKFSTFASHFKEWQKEQKYSVYSSTPKSGGLKFSAFSQTLAKSARKFKSEFDKINIFASKRQRSEEIVENIPPKPKVTLLYQNTRKKRNQFVRLDELPDEEDIKDDDNNEDDEDVYLLPKTPKLVTFAESTSTLSFSSHSASSVSENHWLW